jgi:hypothetical protein
MDIGLFGISLSLLGAGGVILLPQIGMTRMPAFLLDLDGL